VQLLIPIILSISEACGPTVSPETMAAIALAESGGDPLAIGINGPSPGRLHPISKDAAVRVATQLLKGGASLDLGLAQINSRNLAPLGLTVATAFDPCRNIEAAAKILTADYLQSTPGSGGEQAALRTSLSLYNTGDRQRGFHNGYVAKVTAAATRVVPALTAGLVAPLSQKSTASADSADPSPPSWDVFGQTIRVRSVFLNSVSTAALGDRR
jgi:type IV secretion system protein VirB1